MLSRHLPIALVCLGALIFSGCEPQSEADVLRAQLIEDAADIERRAAQVQSLQQQVWQMEHAPGWDQAAYDALVQRYYGERDTLLGMMTSYGRDLATLQKLDPTVKVDSTVAFNLDRNSGSSVTRMEMHPAQNGASSSNTPMPAVRSSRSLLLMPGSAIVRLAGVPQDGSEEIRAATKSISIAVWLASAALFIALFRAIR
jgi:hypothetical protein